MIGYQITTQHVWYGGIPDRPDALGQKLRALSAGGLNLELIIVRKDMPGRSMLYVSPLRTLEEVKIAEQAGLEKSNNIRTIRVQGPNIAGLGAQISTALSRAGINISDFSGAALGNLSVTNIVLDDEEQIDAAVGLLRKAFASQAAG